MAFKDMFSRNRKALDAPEGDGVSPVASNSPVTTRPKRSSR